MHLLLSWQLDFLFHLLIERQEGFDSQRWSCAQQLSSNSIRTACFIRKVAKSPCQLAEGELLKLLGMVSRQALEVFPGWWPFILVDLPELPPIFKPLGHTFIGWQVPVRPFPSQFTAAKAAE